MHLTATTRFMGRMTAAAWAVFLLLSPQTAQAQSDPRLAASIVPISRLALLVPFPPTAFQSAGRTYLFYELHLSNPGPVPVTLQQIDVVDAKTPNASPISALGPEQLATMFRGGDRSAEPLQIPSKGAAVVFLEVSFDRGAGVPDRLSHRVTSDGMTTEGAVVGTHATSLRVLGPPVKGAGWLASDGPGNTEDNHHRRGLVALGGRPVISRRYAIDWIRVDKGVHFIGDASDARAYLAYGQAVVAVADGRVMSARNDIPENRPGHGAAFNPAVPITLDTVQGDNVTLDIGGGQFAYYMHLQPGSVRVTVGQRVRRGQEIGRLGISGDAREPHLHFEVTNSPKALMGEGLPYLIDRYRLMESNEGVVGPQKRSLPLDGAVIDFASAD